jgi:matrixin/putative peptidoglycan binding protein/tectonin-like protein
MSKRNQKTQHRAELRIGDKGPEVTLLQSYLRNVGYLDFNPYERWGEFKLVPAQSVDGVFDEVTESALLMFQIRHDLPMTGYVDTATLAFLNSPQCGVADIIGYNHSGSRWEKLDLTYGFQEMTNDLSPQLVRNAIQRAFSLWSTATLLSFDEVPLRDNPDIIIRFAYGNHGDNTPFIGEIYAHGFYPPPLGANFAGDVHFNDAYAWRFAADLEDPDSFPDLMYVAAHEIGHAIGLEHSSEGTVMYRGYAARRSLHEDDIDGIRAIYDPTAGRRWNLISGTARDIGVGAGGAIWAVGTNFVGSPSGHGPGMSIHRWNGNAWDPVDGAATRIAVAPDGTPWVTNNFLQIYRRTADGWQRLPGAAYDVGIGANGAVWVVGTNQTGPGYGVYRWNGVDWDPFGGSAVNIAVGPDGLPWITNSLGEIWRWTGADWVGIQGRAIDIGIGADSSVWVVGTNENGYGGYGLYKWQNGKWVRVEGAGYRISVGQDGLPWISNRVSAIYRRV